MNEAETEELRERLKYETPFWAEACARIINERGEVVPLKARPWQAEFDEALEAQRAAGKPMRAIVLKARKLGYSTWVQAKLMQRVTQLPNRNALVVAQDGDTAGELFGIGYGIYGKLPAFEHVGSVKPPLANRRLAKGGTRFLYFAEPSRALRDEGKLGLNSKLEVDTAKEVAGGRGFTYHYLHLSEVAFWPNPEKMVALLNAVPYESETMVVIESTANGYNFFRDRYLQAKRGEGEYIAIFMPWHRDPRLQLAFASGEDRAAFVEQIGSGPWGEEEPWLVEEFGCTPEQLNWRRMAIVDQHNSDLEFFHQEYPATEEQAFIGSGRTIFSPVLIQTARRHATEADEPERGVLRPAETKRVNTRSGTFDVPVGAEWWPSAATGFPARHPWLHVWEHPVTPERLLKLSEEGKITREELEERLRLAPFGQYVIGVDVMGGAEDAAGKVAYHAIEVIDHVTRMQVAEYRSRVDDDELRDLVHLCAVYYNRAIVAVEVTGGWGAPIARTLHRDFRYEHVYRRKPSQSVRDKQTDYLGWYTDSVTKPALELHMTELLKEERDGIRSQGLAEELPVYVRDERGRGGAQAGEFVDRLVAYMIAQYVGHEIRPRSPQAKRAAAQPYRPNDPLLGY